MDALIPKQFDDTLGALLLGGLFAMACATLFFEPSLICGVDAGLVL